MPIMSRCLATLRGIKQKFAHRLESQDDDSRIEEGSVISSSQNDAGFSTVSFSVEAEDLIINRLFDACLIRDPNYKGSFIDIGAWHPVRGSNTYFFYKRGWRGINVEPNPEFISEFRRIRGEDITVNAAVSSTSGALTYHRFSDGQLNGFLTQNIVDYHIGRGVEYLGCEAVECIGIE